MAQEKEIKIALKIPLNSFIRRLEKAGYQDKGKTKQLDIYFDTRDWYLYNSIAALRIRLVDGLPDSFAFKKVYYLPTNSQHYYVEELETPFPLKDREGLVKILEKVNVPVTKSVSPDHKALTNHLKQAGYFDEQKMLKIRHEYRLDDKSLTVDEIENVGTIIELECSDSEPLLEVAKILEQDEWENNSKEGTGYIWLRNVKGFTKHLSNYKRFETEPDWNIWESERGFYAAISGAGSNTTGERPEKK